MNAAPRDALMQIAALVIALIGVVWDSLLLEWVLFPGGSGEWVALAEPAAYFVGVPCGLVALALAWKSPRGRRLTAWARSAAVLSILIPVVVTLLLRRR